MINRSFRINSLFILNRLSQRLFQLLILGILFFTLIAPVMADEPSVQRLTKLLNQMSSLDADFQQRILDARGSRLQEVSGHLSLQRPGQFYWQTENPFPQTVISDGETLWLYDPDLEQVTVQQVDSSVSRTPAMLLSGDVTSMGEKFDVNRIRSGEAEEFLLQPKEEDSLFEELRLNFSQQQLVSLLLVDSLGQRTSIELFDRKLNTALDSDRFTFQIPEDVDVILQ